MLNLGIKASIALACLFAAAVQAESAERGSGEIRILARCSDPGLAARMRCDRKDSVSGVPDLAEPIPVMQGLAERFNCLSAAPLTPWDPSEGTVVLVFPDTVAAPALVAAYRGTGLFDWVEVDGAGRAHGERSHSALSAPAVKPNDPYYNLQYALKNDGTRTFANVKSKSGADIDAEAAWGLQAGDSSLIVAVLDGGVALSHPELAGRLWKNPREIAGNGQDDDGNGFVDDVNGWNFAVNQQGGNANVADDYGHGTNVAGIIGAISGNSLGVAGVARCRVLPVKVLDSQNSGLYSWWAAGIRYAVQQGAKVINLSLGGQSTSFSTLKAAVEYALANNVTVVASMGNQRSETPDYPAAFDGIIAVGATGPDDNWVRSFTWDTTKGSNFGKHISVSAPGSFIHGLDYRNHASYQSYWSGTSQASPMVAGVCALLLSQGVQRTPAEIKRLIETGAEDGVGDASLDSPGWDRYYGNGRLNAYRSLLAGMPVAIRPALRQGAPGKGYAHLRGPGFDILGRQADPILSGRRSSILPGR
jgi:subtilisin family serine protease